MSNRRFTYCFNQEENIGSKKCDILLQHYEDVGFRTRVLSKEEFEGINAWTQCSLLNNAYDAGYKHAMEDLRRFIGVKD